MRGLLGLTALAAAGAVPGMGRSDPGYSGCKSRPHSRVYVREGAHICAKTLRSIKCRVSTSAPNDLRNRAERLQMLKARRERRAAREAQA